MRAEPVIGRYLVSALMVSAACAGVEAGNPSITVEVDGDDAEADARKMVRGARDACDIGVVGAVAESPKGVNVTVKFPDGDTDELLIDCDDGEVHRR